MAAEVGSMPVNGNYAPHQGYGNIDHQAAAQQNNFGYGAAPNTGAAQPPPSTAQATPSSSTSGPSNAQAEIPKDEVGWYFVEQYYTTLSRSPEKLYLFYNKRSQFVSGQETDKVAVCIGQRAINDRIKELDFQDCKVRVTNVDSQASDANIVIQVIGEISNKSQPHKKFTQTFVLAPQNNGYFVLNDIFRYIIEEEDEREVPQEQAAASTTTAEEVQQVPAAESGVQEPPSSVEQSEPKTLTSSLDPKAQEHDAKQVDKELEDKILKDDTKQADQEVPAAVNGVAAPAKDEEKTEEAIVASQPTPAATESAPSVTHEVPEAEKPKDPEPTPAASPPKQQPAQPAAPPKPAMPKTWANLAAAAHKTTAPAAPSSTTSTPPQQSQQQSRPTPPSAKQSSQTQTSATTPTPAAPAAQRADSPATSGQDEWTAVGGSHNRSQSKQQAPQQEQQQNRGYIKNVHENVDPAELRKVLEKFGELEYFDVARAKNCAFVNFRSQDGYRAAVAANPHKVGDDKFYVEERRIQPGRAAYTPRGGSGAGGYAGGRGGGRGGASGGAPGGGRGGYGGRGGARGGSGAGRGRGGQQGGA